jgi:hypothetical protein
MDKMSPVPQGTAEFIAHIFSAQARLRTRAEYFRAVTAAFVPIAFSGKNVVGYTVTELDLET